jgi:quercetin dioxygenase-like cupin family protein
MSHCALFLCLGCIGATFMLAQAADPEVEITNEPHHHLTFQNLHIRVFNVQVDPNTQTEMHRHRHDYIAVTLGDAEISNTVQGKPTLTLKLHDGDTIFASGNFAHYVGDLGAHPFRNVTVELLQDASLRNSAASGKTQWDEERGLDILDRGTKEILFVKDGVRVTEFELQPGGVIPPHRYSGPHLLIAVTDFDLHEDSVRSDIKPLPAHFRSGDHKWLPAGYSHTIANTGPATAKFVTLEFPE